MHSGEFCAVLATCSSIIWSERARAERVGLTRLETSDTELIIQNLAEASIFAGKAAALRQFTARDEADYGADLEIWLQLEHGFHIGFTIQAKRTTFTKRRLLQAGGITQRSGTKGRNTLQREDLVTHGQAVEANPVHVLYSGWNDPRTGDPLMRGRGTPAQYGASVLPTWWFNDAHGWPNPHGGGKARVDPFSDIILPLELLLKPEDIRQSSPRAQALQPWFGGEFRALASTRRTDNFMSGLFFPFDRRRFGDVSTLMAAALGSAAAASEELVDYAVLGVGMGSIEYGPSASSGGAPTEPFDFGLSRTVPAYVPRLDAGGSGGDDTLSDDPNGAPDVGGPWGNQGDGGDDRDGGARDYPWPQSRLTVDIVDDLEAEAEWKRSAGVEALPRLVLALS